MRNAAAIFLAGIVAMTAVPVNAQTVSENQIISAQEAFNAEEWDFECNDHFDEDVQNLCEASSDLTDEAILDFGKTLRSDYSMLKDEAKAAFSLKKYEEEKTKFLLGEAAEDYGEAITNEWKRQQYLTAFGIGEDAALVELLPVIRVTEAEADGDALHLAVEEWNILGYRIEGSESVSVSFYRFSYRMTLTDDENDRAVAAVFDTEQNYSSLAEQGVRITAQGFEMQEACPTDWSEMVDEEELVGAIQIPSYTYNVNKAIEYANKWALKRNPAYNDYSNEGGDCANFVSQCLFAGGLPRTSGWDHRKWPAMEGWISNEKLREYLVGNNMGSYVHNIKPAQLKKGDLVYYNWSGDKSWTQHVTIVVGKDKNGQPIINSHTRDWYHARWNYGVAGTYYSAVLMKAGKQSSTKSSGSSKNSGSTAKSSNSTKKSSSGTAKSSNSTTKSSSSTAKSSTVKNSVPKTDGTVWTIVIYRVYNKRTGEHFYTANVTEKNNLVKLGWKDEGIGWYAPSVSTVPVHRLYNPNTGDHHYTTNNKERANLVKLGWKGEGIAWYSDTAKGVPLYREYNPNAQIGSHNYTTMVKEHLNLVKIGWKNEGIAWYGTKVKAAK